MSNPGRHRDRVLSGAIARGRGSIVPPTLFVVFILGCWSPLMADSCIWSDSETGTSSDQRFSVTVHRTSEDTWAFRWVDQRSGKASSGPVQGLEMHAHPQVHVTTDGSRFSVSDLSAGHRFEDRIMIYDSTGKLIRSLGIDDILMFHQRDQVSMSISHISWTSYDRATDRWIWLEDDENRLFLVTKDEHRIAISLQDGQVIRQPWIMNLIPFVPWVWLGVAGSLLMARVVGSRHAIVQQYRPWMDVSIVASLMMGALILIAWHNEYEFYFFPQTSVYSVAIFAALCGLVLVWGFSGTQRWPTRLLGAMTSVAALLTTFALMWVTNDFFTTNLLCGLLSGMLVMSILFACVGLRLRKGNRGATDNADDRSSDNTATKGSQFRLGDLLLWMMSIAVLITASRFVPWHSLPGGFQWMPYATGVAYALVAMFAGLAGLTRVRFAWLGILVLMIGCIGISVVAARRWGDTFSWRLLVCYVLSYLTLLLVFRLHGYQLKRRVLVDSHS